MAEGSAASVVPSGEKIRPSELLSKAPPPKMAAPGFMFPPLPGSAIWRISLPVALSHTRMVWSGLRERNQLAVGADRQPADALVVGLPLSDFLGGLDVPDVDRALRTEGQRLAVGWRKRRERPGARHAYGFLDRRRPRSAACGRPLG